MNPIQSLFQAPWVARLGWTLLHFLWQGTLIALLFAIARLHRSANFRYAAGCLALAAMVGAPVVTYVVLANAGPGTALPPISAAVADASDAAGAASLPPLTAWDWVSPRLGAAWVLGVMLFAIRLLGGWRTASRIRGASAKAAPPEWQSRLHQLMEAWTMRRPVRLLVSSMVEVPSVIGWWRPVILMPVGAFAGLPATQLEALLAHELAHIRRHDYLANLLQSVAEALLFYHPAVWWVSKQVRAEREHCCDDLAVEASGGDVLTYARALADLESCRPAHLQALAATGGSLRNRIRRLLEPAPRRLASGGAAWGVIALLLVGCVAAAVRDAETPAPQQDPIVERSTIWTDTVKQGDLLIEVRGLGTLTSTSAAEVQLAQSQAKEVTAGQAATIAFEHRTEVVACRVTAVRPGAKNGLVTADLAILAPLPGGVNTGARIDSTIKIGSMTNVVYVGRPVFGDANSESTLFKIDSDGQRAIRTKVQFGRSSVNTIEVKSGLQPGDQVILSDLSAYKNYNVIALK